MLSFLRARRSPPSAPACRMEWDGRVLAVVSDADEVALDLDGAFFASAKADAQGLARFEFPFAPQRGVVAALPRRGRDGSSLTDAPVELRFGEAGLRAARKGTPPSLAPLDMPARDVPFGFDVGAIEVAIVVPVYDAPASVERCLDSVLAHTTGRAQLIVIDDASPDLAIAPLLDRYASIGNVRILRNASNLGFTATANRGIAQASRADVVLLNADTEVGPNWLSGLRRAAYCAADVATATAVSDNAGAFSVPELERENPLPAGLSLEDAARALWQDAGRAYPELPTGNGFCMYIRRSVIDAVGALDEAAFPEGYGEENDFCQRASARRFRHVIAGNVFVHHERSRSFGHERRARLGEAGMAVLRQRWPNYEADVGASLFSFERLVLDWRVRRVFAGASEAKRMRVLRIGDVALPDRYDVRDAATCDVDLKNEADVWSWLQSNAIDAVVANSETPASLPHLAAALGIPFARAVGRDDALRAVNESLQAARSFKDDNR